MLPLVFTFRHPFCPEIQTQLRRPRPPRLRNPQFGFGIQFLRGGQWPCCFRHNLKKTGAAQLLRAPNPKNLLLSPPPNPIFPAADIPKLHLAPLSTSFSRLPASVVPHSITFISLPAPFVAPPTFVVFPPTFVVPFPVAVVSFPAFVVRFPVVVVSSPVMLGRWKRPFCPRPY